VSNQRQETKNETRISEKANSDTRRKQKDQSEFLERLDFLVTFLAMKKVT
jgi:hypothetical protein